jgi:hypothetical protein
MRGVRSACIETLTHIIPVPDRLDQEDSGFMTEYGRVGLSRLITVPEPSHTAPRPTPRPSAMLVRGAVC